MRNQQPSQPLHRSDKEQLPQSTTDKYASILQQMPLGFCIVEVLFEETNQPLDYRFLEVNPLFEQQTGLVQAVGKTMRQLQPAHEQHWFDAYAQVVKTGRPMHFEQEAAHLAGGVWYTVYAFPVGPAQSHQVAIFFQDITQKKRAEAALQQSEAKYRSLFESIDQGFHRSELIYDPAGRAVDWRFLEVNAIFESQTGLQNAVGQLGSVISPNTETYWLDAYDRVVRTGEPIRLENYNAFTDRWYLAHAYRVGEVDNRQFAVLFEDITQRKRQEQRQDFLLELTDALRIYRSAAELQVTACRLLAQQLGASRVNYAEVEGNHYRVAYEYRQDELPSMIGQYAIDSFRPAERAAFEAGRTVVIADIAAEPTLTPAEAAAYAALNVRAFVSCALVSQGKWVVVLSVICSQPRPWRADEMELVKETAERTWVAVERAKAEEQLRQANRHKDEFLAMLAHELRNPMATLHNTLLLMKLTQGQDETLPLERALTMMSREVTHLNRMVDDLLDVSRISQGKIHLKKGRLDLGRLLREAFEAIRFQFSSREQSLILELPNGPFWVDGDRTRLTQVIRNLATNAVKYTPSGGQIRVSLAKEGRQAILQIQDNGIGLAADQLEAIFEAFVQVSSSLDRPQGGLGLGLAVVKQLVEMHGGQVSVQSPGLGQGSAFTVRLPLLSDVPASRPSAGVGPEIAKKAWRILVVDDNADLAQTTAMLLRLKTYEAATCLSGLEALEAVASNPPDVVLLDLGMPGMDGFETCRRLRALDWGQHGLIVALSGYGQPEDLQRTRAAGFDGHLVKPVDLPTLTTLLDTLLNTNEPTG